MRKKLCALMMTLVLLLTACGGGGNEAEEILQKVRGRYLEMTACAGHVEITADYGQRVYSYGIDFTWAREGETKLVLTSPHNVAGTTARIAAGETALEYDGVMMETGALDSAGLTPMDALPALLAYAQDGYLAECVTESWENVTWLHVTCRDPDKDPGQGVEAQLWFLPQDGTMTRGEISEDGRTVILCDFTDFVMTTERE